jgi:hypothetical protein
MTCGKRRRSSFINPLFPALRSGPTTAPGAYPKSKFLRATDEREGPGYRKENRAYAHTIPMDEQPLPCQITSMAAKKKTTPKSARGKRPTKKAVNQAKGKRYTAAEKSKVIAMVEKVNAEKGRGGITAASRKFGVTPLTISAWMRNAGLATRGGGKVDAGHEVFQRLAELHKMILQTEEELSALNREYAALKRKL